MKLWPNAKIQLGKDCQIDEDVILGYPSRSPEKGGQVLVGDNAKIRSGSILYQNVKIGNHFQTGHHVIVREENEIGDDVCIWSNTVIDYGCRIASRVKIHTGVYVAQYTVIEDEVFIAPGTIFANDKYPLSDHLEGPHIKKGVRIGVNVTILPGVEIGEDVLVGAGSVVTKNIPDGAIVAGNPARTLRSVTAISAKRK